VLSVAAALWAGLLLAGCGEGGSTSSCSLDSCTVTLDRGGEAKGKVFGVEVKLVKVDGEKVVLEVAGSRVTAKAGQPIDVHGLQVEVQEVTDKEVKLKISKGEG